MIEQIIKDHIYGQVTEDAALSINMDVKLRVGGRKAPKGGAEHLTMDAVKEYLIRKGNISLVTDEINTWYDVFRAMEETTNIADDFKYDIYAENVDIVDKIYTTTSGLDYLIVSACGDWQIPTISFLYWDGNKYRIYTPLKGNPINPISKLAFGEDYDADYAFYAANPQYEEAHIPANLPACIEDFESRIEII